MEIIGTSRAQWTRFTPTVPYLKIYTEKKKIFYVKQNMFFEELQVGGYRHKYIIIVCSTAKL